MKRLIFALFAAVLAVPACAQTLMQNVPANTLMGRLGNGTSGPVQAIPLSNPNIAGNLGFKQSGTGAVTRTMQQKDRERVSGADFGGNLTDAAASSAAKTPDSFYYNGNFNLNYGSSGSPQPPDLSAGYVGSQNTLYTNGNMTTAAAVVAVLGDSHRAAGQGGIATGGLFRSYNDASWVTGGVGEAGNVALQSIAHTSVSGTIFGMSANEECITTTGCTARGFEIDLGNSAAPADKVGQVIVSNQNDTAQATGTQTIRGTATSTLKSIGYQLISVNDGVGVSIGLSSAEFTGNVGQAVAPGGTLWLHGGSQTINAGSFVVGRQYTIASVGTTNFTSIGAASNTVGVGFTATGIGSGSGTAYDYAVAKGLEWQTGVFMTCVFCLPGNTFVYQDGAIAVGSNTDIGGGSIFATSTMQVGSTSNGSATGQFKIGAKTSGALTITTADTASGTLKFPGTGTDFTATGGTSQVVKQTSAGGAFTVAQLIADDIAIGAGTFTTISATGNLTFNSASGNGLLFQLSSVSKAQLQIDTVDTYLDFQGTFHLRAGYNGSSVVNISSSGITLPVAAETLILKRGSNGAVGTFVCTSGGTITISNTYAASTDAIIISLNTAGGTQSTPPNISQAPNGTQFQAKCATSDTGTYNYAIIKNAA